MTPLAAFLLLVSGLAAGLMWFGGWRRLAWVLGAISVGMCIYGATTAHAGVDAGVVEVVAGPIAYVPTPPPPDPAAAGDALAQAAASPTVQHVFGAVAAMLLVLLGTFSLAFRDLVTAFTRETVLVVGAALYSSALSFSIWPWTYAVPTVAATVVGAAAYVVGAVRQARSAS